MKIPSFGFATLLFAGAMLLGSSNSTKAQSYELSPLWSIPAETPGYEWISTNHTQRSLAYNATTTHLLTVSRYPATNAAVYILDSGDGTHLGNLSVSGVFTEINFPLNTVAVADDGVIYACNLTLDPTNTVVGNNGPFRIYRWANEGADPTVAYLGDPSEADELAANRRFGDCFAVRGSGVDTEILVGSRSGTNVTRFTSINGIDFTHQKIIAAELTAKINTMSIAFGAGNTFWTKPQISAAINYPLQHFSFDPGTATATLLQNYTNAALMGGPVNFDINRKLLGIIDTMAHEFRLFKLTESGFVQQDITRSFGVNPNGNNTGAVVFAGDKLFALESNNSLLAYTISTNQFVPFSTTVSAHSGEVTLTWPSQLGFIYQAQIKDDLTQSSWTNLGEATNGTGATISISDPVGAGTKFYQIRAE